MSIDKKISAYIGAAAVALLIFGGTFPAQAGGDETRFRAALAGTGDVGGQADFRARDGQQKFSVETEGLGLSGDSFDVKVGTEIVGTIVIDAFGFGDLSFDSNVEVDGVPDTTSDFPANFPSVHAGTTIEVGSLSGNLQNK